MKRWVSVLVIAFLVACVYIPETQVEARPVLSLNSINVVLFYCDSASIKCLAVPGINESDIRFMIEESCDYETDNCKF